MIADKRVSTICCVKGLFAVGRLLSIPLATWFTPNFMLLCNIVSLRCLSLSDCCHWRISRIRLHPLRTQKYVIQPNL